MFLLVSLFETHNPGLSELKAQLGLVVSECVFVCVCVGGLRGAVFFVNLSYCAFTRPEPLSNGEAA